MCVEPEITMSHWFDADACRKVFVQFLLFVCRTWTCINGNFCCVGTFPLLTSFKETYGRGFGLFYYDNHDWTEYVCTVPTFLFLLLDGGTHMSILRGSLFLIGERLYRMTFSSADCADLTDDCTRDVRNLTLRWMCSMVWGSASGVQGCVQKILAVTSEML